MPRLGMLPHSTEGAALCFLAYCQEGFPRWAGDLDTAGAAKMDASLQAILAALHRSLAVIDYRTSYHAARRWAAALGCRR